MRFWLPTSDNLMFFARFANSPIPYTAFLGGIGGLSNTGIGGISDTGIGNGTGLTTTVIF